MKLPFVLSVYHFWMGFQPIFEFATFLPFLHCKTAIFGTPMVGGLKMILFQKFFLVLFYITKLQYKPPGTKKVCLSPPPRRHLQICGGDCHVVVVVMWW